MFRVLLTFGAGLIVGALGASYSLGYLKGVNEENQQDQQNKGALEEGAAQA